MHERSLMADLFRRVDEAVREHDALGVERVRVRLGAFSHLSAEHLRGHFDDWSRGTAAEGAVLDVDTSEDVTDPHAGEILLVSLDLRFAPLP